MNVCASESPKPLPPSLPDTSGLKIRSWISSGTPGPSSTTCNSSASLKRWRRIVIWRTARVRKTMLLAPAWAALRAMRRKHAVHQRLQPVGLLDDPLRVFAQFGPVELALEQLRRAAQPAERILDLVREIADQLAVGLLLEHQALFARKPQLLLDRAQLDEQREPVRLDSRDHAGERHRLVPGANVADVLRRVVPVGGARLTQRALELLALGKELQERLAEQAFRAGSEQVFRRWIGVAHHQRPIERHDGGGQQFKAGEFWPVGSHLA